MTHKLLALATLSVAMAVLGPARATAAPVTWSLQNVVFTDGGQAFGSFAYDAETNTYTAINISTTATGGIPATIFQYKSIFGTLPTVAVFLDSNAADLTGFHDLTLRFTSDLTSSGGSIPLLLSSGSFETTCGNAICGSVVAPSSFITGGSVTTNPAAAVPEPAAVSMIILGLSSTLVSRSRWVSGQDILGRRKW
jgi:hypothetical protein